MNTKKILEAHKRHDNEIRLLKKKYAGFINPDLQVTQKVLLQFSRRMDNIFKTMIFCAKDDDYYTSAILFRSMIEHFFRAFYVMAKSIQEKTDQTAENFEKLLFVAEYHDEQRSVHKMESIIKKVKPDFKNSDFITDLKLMGFDKQNEKQIEDIKEEYKIASLITWFYEKQKNVNPVVLQLLPDYSRLCSYTHAGSLANFFAEKYITDKTLQHELESLLSKGLTCAGVAKENVFASYTIPSSFLNELQNLQTLRKA